ncbi:MAG: hypothetical protein KGK09_03600 [Burkholderiales bacterium]|nr:hypothetical protein [Burkholderiales bacterium]
MGAFSVWHWLVIAVVAGALVMVLRRRSSAGAAADGLTQAWSLNLPRGDADTYSRAEALRDDIGRRFRAAAARVGLATTSYESVRGNGDVWLRLEFVKPEPERPELSLRCVLALSIERHDFHHFEHVLRIEAGRGTQRHRAADLIELQDDDIAQLVDFARGARAAFPKLRSRRLRRQNWEFWRPANKVARLRTDWLGSSLGGVGWLSVGYGLLLAYAGSESSSCRLFGECGDATLGLWLGAFGGALLLGRHLVVRRRVPLVLNAGKPRADPRALVRMDSWQTTLNGLGDRRAAVQAAVLQRLEQSKPAGVTVRGELIGYASVDGKVEREQHVIAFRRAVAFLHLEAYGKDLYVGWDSHVNAGIWREEDVARGLDRVSGRAVVARHVVQGWQQPNEYDLTDASFLTEWLHAALVGVVKQQLAEHRIDQDIDFTIQRESRAAALQAEDPGSKGGKLGRGLLRRKA